MNKVCPICHSVNSYEDCKVILGNKIIEQTQCLHCGNTTNHGSDK